MKLNTMDETLLKINKLKNIESISYKDIISTINDDKYTIIPSFIVFYDGLKILNLTSLDKHFNIFVKKLKQVYLEEKDNIVEDSPIYGKKNIQIDDFTKKMLLESNLDEINSLYKFYNEDNGYTHSLLFKEDELKIIIPIIKHQLKEVLKTFDKVIDFDNKIKGYNNVYSWNTKIDGIPSTNYFIYQKNSPNTYFFECIGLIKELIPISIEINFKDNGISINTWIKDLKYSNYKTYNISEKNITEEKSIYLNENLKSYEKNNLEKTTCQLKNIIDIGYKEELDWYKLPWSSAIYGIKRIKTPISSEKENIIYQRSIYLDTTDNNFIIKDIITKKYKKDSTSLVDTIDVTFDNINKTIIGYKEKDLIILETSFLSDQLTKPRNNYENKYFYHTTLNNSFKNIKEEELIPLNKEKEIIKKTDLLKTNKIKKLIRK